MAASRLAKLRRNVRQWASADYAPHPTPSVLQMEAQECGAACLAMILAHYGRHENLADLRIACGVSRDGCKASNILRTARSLGMYAKGLSASTAELRQMPCPLIIFWQFNHFLVLEGFAKGRAWLNDPARGRRHLSETEFDAGFTGVVLACEPGAGFEKNQAAHTVFQQIVQRYQAFCLDGRSPTGVRLSAPIFRETRKTNSVSYWRSYESRITPRRRQFSARHWFRSRRLFALQLSAAQQTIRREAQAARGHAALLAQSQDRRRVPRSSIFRLSFNGPASLLTSVLVLGAVSSVPGLLLASLAILIFDHRLADFLRSTIAADRLLHEAILLLPGLWTVPLLLGLLAAFYQLQQSATQHLQNRLALRWSSDFLRTLLALPLAFFQQRFAGELAQRVASNQILARIMVGNFLSFASNAFAVCVYLLALAQLNISLAGLAISFCLLHCAVIAWSQQRGFAARQEFQIEQDHFLASLRQGTQQIERLKLAGAEAILFQTWLQIHAKLIRQEQILGRLRVTTEAWPLALSLILMLLVLLLTALALVDGALSVGMMLGLLILLAYLNLSLLTMRQIESKLQIFKMIMARLDDVLQHTPAPISTPTASYAAYDAPNLAPNLAPNSAAEIPLRHSAAQLQIKALNFSYAPFAPPVLQDIELQLAAGQQLALVGPSASGKSTLAKLIAGLLSSGSCNANKYGIDASCTGQIILDGQVLADSSSLRSGLVMLQQQPYLPASSLLILEHLWQQQDAACCGLLEELGLLERMRVWQVQRQLHLGVVHFDEESLAILSLGERQRLALTSAILAQPRLLILDQACSALELGLQYSVLRALRRRGISCVLIAQCLRSVRECEQIIVLDAGKILEQGTHHQLIAQRGHYFALCAADQLAESEFEGGDDRQS